jgi:hypothetical protein
MRVSVETAQQGACCVQRVPSRAVRVTTHSHKRCQKNSCEVIVTVLTVTRWADAARLTEGALTAGHNTRRQGNARVTCAACEVLHKRCLATGRRPLFRRQVKHARHVSAARATMPRAQRHCNHTQQQSHTAARARTAQILWVVVRHHNDHPRRDGSSSVRGMFCIIAGLCCPKEGSGTDRWN